MDLNEYQELAMDTDLSDQLPNNCAPILYHALKLNGEAGEVAEHIGKMFRDDKGGLTKNRREKIIKELGDIQWYIAAIAKRIDVTLEEIAIVNLLKLKSRYERGVLNGDGDDR